MGVGNPLNLPSCVYVWVMNHLRVVFGDAFGLFWGFWSDFWKKGRNQQIWVIFGVLRHGVGIPRSSVGPRRGVAEREVWTASGTLRRCKATSWRRSTSQRSIVHSMEIFMFCFVLLTLYSEDLSIGLMRTL